MVIGRRKASKIIQMMEQGSEGGLEGARIRRCLLKESTSVGDHIFVGPRVGTNIH